jgi:transcriptional regulator with XRE-family HTH domain
VSENQDNEYVVRGPQSIGFAVAEARHRAGVTQAALAEEADVHRSYLSALEGGATTEALRRIVRLFDALDLELVVRDRRRD